MTISNPKVNLNIRGAVVPATIEERKILYIGQKTASGTATSGDLYENLETGIEYETLFGKNSMLAAMIRAAQASLTISKTKPKVDAIPFSDAGGSSAATGTITITGNATANGTLYVNTASSINHRYKIDVVSGQTFTDVSNAIEAAFTADDTVPVTAVNVGGVITLTAVNAGSVANKIGISIEGTVPGITTAIVAMSGGSGDPVISSVETTIENLRYTTIVMPAQYDVATIVTFLENRFNDTDPIIKDGELLITDTDTFANFSASTVGENKKTLTFFANKKIDETLYKGSLHFELDYVISAHIAALRALRLTTGAEITDIVDTSLEASDNFGGIGLATLPYHNTPLSLVPLANPHYAWANDELEELTDKGFALFGNNEANTEAILSTVVTRYKTNTEGQPDVSFKFLNYVDQTSVVREYFTNSLKTRYRQYRLTTGNLVPRINMTNAGQIRAECMRIYSELVTFGLMIGGEEALQAFRNALTVVIDEALGKVTLTMINPPVPQLREFDGIIQTTFTL